MSNLGRIGKHREIHKTKQTSLYYFHNATSIPSQHVTTVAIIHRLLTGPLEMDLNFLQPAVITGNLLVLEICFLEFGPFDV